jgi:hypothetical protein
MKNFQTSISQVYQKILFPYFYHKYLRTYAIVWHKRHPADWRGNPKKVVTFPIFSQNL